MTLYNDSDRFCCAWLRQLIAASHLPSGDVLETPIQQLDSARLNAYETVHLFAGIGGWPLALRLANWPENHPVWTGSCPCQPFSCAGRGSGERDPRHLWPEFRRLIEQCRPPTIFGEQVASKLGREWLARVRADLEALGYAVGCADLCAAGVDAPHIRQRLFWVAHNRPTRLEIGRVEPARDQCTTVERSGEAGWVGDTATSRRTWSNWTSEQEQGPGSRCENGNPWSNFDLIPCLDGKTRRIPLEPAFFPLADGVQPRRVGMLRGAGNAIVPQLAAVFITAFLEATATHNPATP